MMVRLPNAAGQLGSIEDVKNVRELRDIPIRVLRGFFSGVGQLLLAADRLRTEEVQRETVTSDDQAGSPDGLDGRPVAQPSQADTPPGPAAPGAAGGRHRRPADTNAAGQPDGGKKAEAAIQRKFRSLDSTGNVRVLTPDMPAESSSEDDQPPAASAGLPVAGYDGLSLASLRARLRNLDAEQVRALLDYERLAANRADVVTMFEHRIAKLEKLETSPDAP
jgi:hypothetical protein